MPDWIKTTFSLEITQEDIDAADKLRLAKDTSYICPTAKALRRLFPNCEGVRAGWGYATVYYEEEIHNFDVVEYTAHSAYERTWGAGQVVYPRTFHVTLRNIKTKPGVGHPVRTPRRYSKTPGPTAKLGI